MIDFKLSEQQNQIKEMTHWFAENEIRPIAMEAEKLGRVPDDWLDNVNKMGIQLNTSAVGGGSGGLKSGKKKEREGNRMGVLATEAMAWEDPAVTLFLPGAGLGVPPFNLVEHRNNKKDFYLCLLLMSRVGALMR